MAFSKTIQLYIFDGNPNGRIMCELSNWNGRVYKIARNEIAAFSRRADSDHTGVYFLLGKNEENRDTVYIGEAEKVATRLKQHLREREADYWNDCICIMSKDDLRNKAHVKYLEHQFYQLAQQAGRAIVLNSTVPTCSSLSAYDEAMLKEFISNAKLLVNTLGYKVFDTIEETTIQYAHTAQPYFYLKAARGADAKGLLVSDGFAVLQGSSVASSTVASMPNCLQKLRDSLLFNDMVLTETLFPHLREVQRTCEKRIALLMTDLLGKNPAPDKATQQLAWVAHMNSLKAQAEESVLRELVYEEDIV